MGIDATLSVDQENHNLELLKGIVLKDLNEIIRITCDRMGKEYECHIDFIIDLSLIPNGKDSK